MIKDFFDDFEDELSFNNEVNNETADVLCQNIPQLETLPLAMSYVPQQRYVNLYSTAEALNCGTLFKDLNLPFLGYMKKGV